MSRNPRINVSLNPSDLEMMAILCGKKKISMSSLAKKMIEDWLEDYEDTLLASKAEEAEKRWIDEGCQTISHKELCEEFGIESNIQKKQQVISKNSRKTFKKESSARSKKGFAARRKKLASH
jgi:Family of unknown function (DUF6290)